MLLQQNEHSLSATELERAMEELEALERVEHEEASIAYNENRMRWEKAGLRVVHGNQRRVTQVKFTLIFCIFKGDSAV